MAIILRLDIDKPYGRASIPAKILSKVREDYWLPAVNGAGYLRDLAEFLEHLNLHGIPALSYHRICTTPNARVTNLLKEGGHKFGLHAEDTRTKETFAHEVKWLSPLAPELKIHSFTKHGSGELKLGRRHHSPYEPEKYQAWSAELGIPFLFGNGIAKNESSFLENKNFFPDMFWFEPGYQNPNFERVNQALDVAEKGNLVLIVHPENLKAIKKVRDDFETIVTQAKLRGISFTNEVN